MIKYYYSPSSGGFFSPDLTGGAIPEDAIEIGQEQYAALIAGQSAGMTIAPGSGGAPVLVDPSMLVAPPTPQQFQVMVGAAVDEMLDDLARSWRYQNSTRLLAAKGSSNAKFSAEGTAFEAHWAACWTVLDDLEAAVLAGTAQMPATVDEVLALLPAPPERPVVP